MSTRPAVDGVSPSSPVYLTADGRRLLADRARLLDDTVSALRAALEDPEHGVESVEAHQRATQERDRLRVLLRDAGALEHLPHDPHTVDLGDIVTIQLQSGDTESYIVVHAAEAPLENRRISVESPLGGALIGRSVGAEVEVGVSGGGYRCTILGVRRPGPAKT
ncbi:MAG: GreA/GreB family elongation factor [Acidimicrobiales bacterium]